MAGGDDHVGIHRDARDAGFDDFFRKVGVDTRGLAADPNAHVVLAARIDHVEDRFHHGRIALVERFGQLLIVAIGTEDKLENLAEEMAAYLLGKLPDTVTVKDYTPHAADGKSYDIKSNAVVIDKSDIASLEPTEPHGQQGFLIKLKTPVKVTYAPTGQTPHTMSLTVLEVQLGDITTDGTARVIAASDVLIQVGWNYFLVHGDGSEGVHNPPFVNNILDASIAALK